MHSTDTILSHVKYTYYCVSVVFVYNEATQWRRWIGNNASYERSEFASWVVKILNKNEHNTFWLTIKMAMKITMTIMDMPLRDLRVSKTNSHTQTHTHVCINAMCVCTVSSICFSARVTAIKVSACVCRLWKLQNEVIGCIIIIIDRILVFFYFQQFLRDVLAFQMLRLSWQGDKALNAITDERKFSIFFQMELSKDCWHSQYALRHSPALLFQPIRFICCGPMDDTFNPFPFSILSQLAIVVHLKYFTEIPWNESHYT